MLYFRIHQKNPISDLKSQHIDILLNLSASPYTFKKLEIRSKISCFAARHLEVPLIYVNQVGSNDNLIFDGNSFIIDINNYYKNVSRFTIFAEK